MKKIRFIIFTLLGILLIAGFVFLYWSRFTLRPVVPPVIEYIMRHYGSKAIILLNAIPFVVFIIFLKYRRTIEWKSKGVFVAFFLALFAEMFGIPFLIYILYPVFGENFFVMIPHFGMVNLYRHFFILGNFGLFLGAYITLSGMILVMIGWSNIYRSATLVENGIYRLIRHPQYTGIFFVLTGWMIHWCNIVLLILYPVLIFIYIRLSKIEEKDLLAEFGEKYTEYRRRTSAFFPVKYFINIVKDRK
jgi:methanethiol S-methyltransferase